MNSLFDILVLQKTVTKAFGVKWSEKSEGLQVRRRQPDRQGEKMWAVFSAAAWMLPKYGLRGQPYSLSGLNPSQTTLLGSHPGCWRARRCVDGCVGQKYEQTLPSLFDRQVVKNIRGSRNTSYRKLHWESAFLDLFRGCWALKEGEENQLLQLMADVIKPINSWAVRNGKEGERTMGRETWPHFCSLKYHSTCDTVPYLCPSAWTSPASAAPWPNLGVQPCSCHPPSLRKILSPPL